MSVADRGGRRAVEIAAREIERLGAKDELNGFDAQDLEKYARICMNQEDHRLTWIAKLDPDKLPDELLLKLADQDKEEAQDDRRARDRTENAAGGTGGAIRPPRRRGRRSEVEDPPGGAD